MSGGHWNYLAYRLEELASPRGAVPAIIRVVAEIEHELDWGISGDTCYACAKLRVIAGLEQFFDDSATDDSAAVAILRDNRQNRCPKCEAFYKEREARGIR